MSPSISDPALDRIIRIAVDADHHDAEDDQTRALELREELRRAIARECLAAAPVANERAALRELIEALEQYATFPPSIKPALDKARAALSGGSPEPEEEGARQ